MLTRTTSARVVRRSTPCPSSVETVEPRLMLSATPAVAKAAHRATPTPAATAAVSHGKAVKAGKHEAAKSDASGSSAMSPVAIVTGGPYDSLPLRPFSGATAPFYPSDIRNFYGMNNVKFGSTAGDGAGQTIAIIDAYSSSTAAADLAFFDTKFGLPTANLSIVNQTGATGPLPAVNSGWAGEITLDIEWAHAIAPAAKIMLVECNSANTDDLYAGVTMAGNNGASVVSMSFGGGEYDTSDDAVFTHAGVTYLASTGDTGGEISAPSTSPNVVAVGGTAIAPADATGAYGSESAWSGGGGGVSAVEARPAYQANTNTGSTTMRTTPDVSAIASPQTGVITYQNGSYYQVGGTSLSAPVWAGMIAVANQGRALAGLSSLTGYSQTLPRLYQLASADYHDVTTGNNTHAAVAGYDQATGLGTPIAAKLLPDLAGDATVSGRVFRDTNANGTFDAADAADAGLAGQSVYLDLNNNATRDANEPTTTVSSTGTYTFAALVTGGDLLGGLSGTVRLSGSTPTGTVLVGTNSTFTTAYATAATANVALFPTAYADATANDAWTVRTSPTSAATLQVLLNGTVAYTAPASLPNSLSFSFTGSNDSLTIDYANGDPIPAGGLSLTAAAAGNNDTVKLLGTSGNDVITAAAGALTFGADTITLANVANRVVDPRGGTDALTVNGGTVTLPAQSAGGGILARSFSTLSVAAGARLAVATAAARADRSVLVATSASALSVASTGTLDLGGNDLIVRNGTLSAVAALAAGGFAKGAWTGYGLASSAAAADTKRLTALGVTTAANSGSSTAFDGVAVASADVLVKYTYYGDTTLDGRVDGADYTRVDAGYLLNYTGWGNGDLNYDGKVDASDYTLVDNAFNSQGAAL